MIEKYSNIYKTKIIKQTIQSIISTNTKTK